jgi:two-component system, chemotaxis family, chemotaxis protein CheY
MKTLIVEDDFTSRLLLQELLKGYGDAHIAVDGQEALDAVQASLEADEPYDLICLDIMMPQMDGQEALEKMRAMESDHGLALDRASRIVMTTALDDIQNVIKAYRNLCDGYLTKPIHRSELIELLDKLGLVS